MRNFILSTLVLLLAACGASSSPYARVTAGRIGCPASEIELDEVERSDRGPESWVAFCGRSGYVCSSNAPPAHPRARIVCSQLGQPPRAASHYADQRARHERVD